jgi:hypothetical protein
MVSTIKSKNDGKVYLSGNKKKVNETPLKVKFGQRKKIPDSVYICKFTLHSFAPKVISVSDP